MKPRTIKEWFDRPIPQKIIKSVDIHFEVLDHQVAHNAVGLSGGMVSAEYYSKDIRPDYYDRIIHAVCSDDFGNHMGSSNFYSRLVAIGPSKD